MGGVISAQQGQQDVHETPGPVGHHVAMNHALQLPLEALHHGTFDVMILADEEVMSLGLSSHWKGAARILVPLSLCTASGGLSCMSFRMVCMAPAISEPRLLVSGRAQAYLENTSMQQKRYLVFQWPYQQSACPGPSIAWRLPPGYPPDPLGDSADASQAWW